MRADIQDIFIKTPHHKQVLMFSATMPEEMKKGNLPPNEDCKKFLQKEAEIFID
jgi:ATP-dependent RNA helicase UAP56/SUB2